MVAVKSAAPTLVTKLCRCIHRPVPARTQSDPKTV